MKILSLVKNNFTNDARVHKIVTSLKKMGHDVELLAVKKQKELPLFENKDYLIQRIPLFSSLYSTLNSKSIRQIKKKSDNTWQVKLKTKIKKNKLRLFITEILNSISYLIMGLLFSMNKKIELIYANDLDTLLFGFILSKLKNSKIIYDSHEIWLKSIIYKSASTWKKKFWKILEKALISKVDLVITTTEFRAKYLKNLYGLKKVKVIKNCPPYLKIKKTNLLRKEFDISDKKIILLYQGLLDKRRGLLNMVNMVSGFNDLVLVFIGEGPDKSLLFEYINENGLESQVFIKDSVPFKQLPKYTASADIGLQLLLNIGINHYSTISNKIFEYMMAEIAILASDFPEIRKIVKGNGIGEVVQPDSLKEIKIALTKICKNLNQYKKNLYFAKKKYNWNNEEKILKKIIKAIL